MVMSSVSKKPLVKQRSVYVDHEREARSKGLNAFQKRVSFDNELNSGSDEENSQGRHNRQPSRNGKSRADDLLDLFRSGKAATESDEEDDIVISTSKGKPSKGQPKPVPRHGDPTLSSPKNSFDFTKPTASGRQRPNVSPRSPKQHSLDDGHHDIIASSKGKPKPAPRTSPREISKSQKSSGDSIKRKSSWNTADADGRVYQRSLSKSKSLEDSDDDVIQFGKGRTRTDSKQSIKSPVPTNRKTSPRDSREGSRLQSKKTFRNELGDEDGENTGIINKSRSGRNEQPKPRSRLLNELDSDESEEETFEKRKEVHYENLRNKSITRNKSLERDNDYDRDTQKKSREKPAVPTRRQRTRQDDDEEFDGTMAVRKSESLRHRSRKEGEFEDSYGKNTVKPVPPSRGPKHSVKELKKGVIDPREDSAEEESDEEHDYQMKQRPAVPTRTKKHDSSLHGKSSVKGRIGKGDLDDSEDEVNERRMKDPKLSQKSIEKEESESLFGKLKSKFGSKDGEKFNERDGKEKDSVMFGKQMPKRVDRKDGNDLSKNDEKLVPSPKPRKEPTRTRSKLSYLEESDNDEDVVGDDDENESRIQWKASRAPPVPRERSEPEESRDLRMKSSFGVKNDDIRYEKGQNSPPQPQRRNRPWANDEEVDDDEIDGRSQKHPSRAYENRRNSPSQPKTRSRTWANDEEVDDEENDGRRQTHQSRAYRKGSLHSDEEMDQEEYHRKPRPASAKFRNQDSRPKPSPRSRTPSGARRRDEIEQRPQRSGTTMRKASSYDTLPSQDSTRGARAGGSDERRAQGVTVKKALTPQRPGSGKRTGPVWRAGLDDEEVSDEDEEQGRQQGFQRHLDSTPKMRGPMKADRDIAKMTKSPQLQQTATRRKEEYVDDFSPRYKTQRSFGQQRSSSLTNLRSGCPVSYVEDREDEQERRNSLDTVSIRQTVYDNWLSRKNVTLKKELSKKALEKQKEEERIRQEKEKRRSAKLAFRSWSEGKQESLKEQQQKRKSERKEEQDKELEKRIKAKDAKKYFESWKSKKDEEIKDTHRKVKTEERKKKEKEEEDKRDKLNASKKSFENWKSKKDEKLKQTHKEKKKQEKLEKEKMEDEQYEKTIKNADEFQSWVEKKGRPRRAAPAPTLTQRAWVPGSRYTEDCIPSAVKPVIQPPAPNRARTLSASSRLQTMKMYDYR